MRGKMTALMVVAAIMVFGMAAFARQSMVCYPRVRTHVRHHVAKVSTCLTRGVAVTVDGSPLALSERSRIEHGRVLLPMRSAFEGLGATVSWESARREVMAAKGDRHVLLTVGSRAAIVNGRTVQLDMAPRMYGNVVYVPLRAVSESLGGTVAWHPNLCRVAITMPPAPVAVVPLPAPVAEAPPVEVAPPPAPVEVAPPAPVAVAPQPLAGTCILINGCYLTGSATPVMVGSIVMVPAMPVLTQLQAQPVWNAQESQLTACIRGQQVTFTAGSNTAMVGGQTVQLSEAPVMFQGQLYVPLDMVSNAFGGTANYNANQSRVVISTQAVPIG